MRKKYLAFAAVLFCSIFTYGCVAPSGDMDFLYLRQRDIESNLKELRKDIDQLKAELDKKNDLSNLNEKTFELQNKLLELEQIVGESHSHNKERFDTIENRLSTITTDLESKNTLSAPPLQETAKTPAIEPKAPSPETPSTGPSPEPEQDNSKKDYDSGLKEFDNGNYEAARDLLRKYLADNPKGDEAPDAMFFIADSYFKEKLFEESILEYQNIIETWPSNPKIPLCQLNQGLALIEIKKPNEASLFFESLIETYPDSEEAAKAKELLKSLSEPEG